MHRKRHHPPVIHTNQADKVVIAAHAAGMREGGRARATIANLRRAASASGAGQGILVVFCHSTTRIDEVIEAGSGPAFDELPLELNSYQVVFDGVEIDVAEIPVGYFFNLNGVEIDIQDGVLTIADPAYAEAQAAAAQAPGEATMDSDELALDELDRAAALPGIECHGFEQPTTRLSDCTGFEPTTSGADDDPTADEDNTAELMAIGVI